MAAPMMLANASGGTDPDGSPNLHPVLDGGSMTGHGGTAFRLYVALDMDQDAALMNEGVVQAPMGRGGTCYWALKSTAERAVASLTQARQLLQQQDVVVRPVSITQHGLAKMLESGHFWCADEGQWRLAAPLRLVGPRSQDGRVYYVIHDGRRPL